MANELFISSIRRRIDKGEQIKTNEIRAMLAIMKAQEERIKHLEQLPLIVQADDDKQGVK